MKRTTRKNRFKRSKPSRGRGFARGAVFLLKTAAAGVLLALMSTAFIFGYDLLTQCDYFNAETVKVTGNRWLTVEAVRRQAGVEVGVNILAVNLSLARKRLIAHPRIADASVARELPATIAVSVREHVPLAILDLGRRFLVNTDGEIYKEVDPSDPRNLPVVTGLTFSDITAGGSPRSESFDAVMAVLELGRQRGSVLPNHKIRRIDVDREIGLTLYPGERVRAVKVGYDNYPVKFRKLGNVLLYFEKGRRFSRLDAIDLNNVNRIVITPAAPDSPDGDHKEV